MSIWARSVLTRERRSFAAGRSAGQELIGTGDLEPKLLLVHLTINHRQERFLEGLRSVAGDDVPIVGCSGQGVMGRGAVYEEGYAASVLALGGDLGVATACVEDIAQSTAAKGKQLAEALRSQLGTSPGLTLLYYDPLPGADVAELLQPLDRILKGPVAGAAAAHFFSTVMTTTYQYWGTSVLSRAAVGVSLRGDFEAHIAYSTGVAPLGLQMTVTKSAGCFLYEFDHQPALEVWQELTGASGPEDAIANAALALGLPDEEIEGGWAIRAPYVLRGEEGLMVQTPVPEGTRVAFFHRTVSDVLEGTQTMVRDLERRLQGKRVHAVLGFECGGRTAPFLGVEATNRENLRLQQRLGEAAYAGLICWGELFPAGGRTRVHNYAFPVVALSGSRG